jgi:CheY-like chemotaxis protein
VTPGPAHRRVLVVEDEWIIAEQIVEAVLEAGHDVAGPTGQLREACRLVETTAIHAALLDINLAGDRSFTLAARLAEASIPFAFLSGYSSVDLPPGLEGRPLVQKPVDRATVREILARLLAQ